jgi:hypothetical protein
MNNPEIVETFFWLAVLVWLCQKFLFTRTSMVILAIVGSALYQLLRS